MYKNQFGCCERMNGAKERETVQRLSSLIVASVKVKYFFLKMLEDSLKNHWTRYRLVCALLNAFSCWPKETILFFRFLFSLCWKLFIMLKMNYRFTMAKQMYKSIYNGMKNHYISKFFAPNLWNSEYLRSVAFNCLILSHFLFCFVFVCLLKNKTKQI